jgi:hypothetical protein
MRIMFTAAAALVALAGSADAATPKHKWFDVNYPTGTLGVSQQSPEEFYNYVFNFGGTAGVHFDRITPDQVTKGDKGEIHVHMNGAKGDQIVYMDFFTSKDQCDAFVKDQGITPQQAPSGDIN